LLTHPTTDRLRELGLVGMLVHSAHRIDLKGESLRKLRAAKAVRLDETAGG
jgi:hypothetical protein